MEVEAAGKKKEFTLQEISMWEKFKGLEKRVQLGIVVGLVVLVLISVFWG